MNLIDIPLTQEQFDDFDAAVVNALCNATRSDLREWSARLLQAWATDDAEAISRARAFAVTTAPRRLWPWPPIR